MSERWKKSLMWGTLITFILSAGAIMLYMTNVFNATTLAISISFILILVSGIILSVLLTIKFKDQKWFLRTSEISTYLLPVFIFLQYLTIDFIHSDIIVLFTIIVVSEFMLLGIINVFILREAGEVKFVLILLVFIITSFVFLKISFLESKLPDFDVVLFIFLNIITGCGMLLFGFRCLFQTGKNSYLKTVSFIACLLIAYGSIVFIAKMQSEKIEVLEFIYFVPAFILTLIVLFSLPFSNYIQWSRLHKRIISKVMIAWFFFFIIFSISFVSPASFKKIINTGKKTTTKFYMYDYVLKNKNGLEPD